jgi:hypothetical protein
MDRSDLNLIKFENNFVQDIVSFLTQCHGLIN